MGKAVFNVLGVLLMVAMLLIMVQAECASGAENIKCETDFFDAH